MAKCGTVSLAVAAVAAISVAVGLFMLYSGVTAVLKKQADTIAGLAGTEGDLNQTFLAFEPAEGPLIIFLDATLEDPASVCDSVYDSLSVKLVPSPFSPPTTFDLADFGSSVGTDGAMTLTKDCVPGSLGGTYSILTVAATFDFAVCETNCDRYAVASFTEQRWDWNIGYMIESESVGVWAFAMVSVELARDTLTIVWDTAGSELTWFMIWAAVGAVIGVGACFVMEEDSSDEANQELATA